MDFNKEILNSVFEKSMFNSTSLERTAANKDNFGMPKTKQNA